MQTSLQFFSTMNVLPYRKSFFNTHSQKQDCNAHSQEFSVNTLKVSGETCRVSSVWNLRITRTANNSLLIHRLSNAQEPEIVPQLTISGLVFYYSLCNQHQCQSPYQYPPSCSAQRSAFATHVYLASIESTPHKVSLGCIFSMLLLSYAIVSSYTVVSSYIYIFFNSVKSEFTLWNKATSKA